MLIQLFKVVQLIPNYSQNVKVLCWFNRDINYDQQCPGSPVPRDRNCLFSLLEGELLKATRDIMDKGVGFMKQPTGETQQ